MKEEFPKRLPIEVRKGKILGEDGMFTHIGLREIFQKLKSISKEQNLDLTKDTKILEVGSGNAVLLDFLKRKGLDIVGVDTRPRGIKDPKQVIARIEQLPFPAESFDVIFSIEIFDLRMYNQDQDLMTQEIVRVLKKGGLYIAYEDFDQPGVATELTLLSKKPAPNEFTLDDKNPLVYRKS